jgi:hypothetical protein
MTYEKPEHPPPLMPSRTAASGVPRCASYRRANTAAPGEMLIMSRLPDGAGADAGVATGASVLGMLTASDMALEFLRI